jgi:CRISPR/Cas system CSM-associated protein Csm3 (group 7 of RAMP superfamily)
MSNKNEISLKLIPDSSFLLGGVSVNPVYDSVTALEDDLPYLTATAIKGALRMDFEAFVRGLGDENAYICDIEERKEGDENPFQGCEDEKCLSCRLFGGGNKEGKLRFNAAFLENGKTLFPVETRKDLLEKGRREGVSISRTLGKAKEKSYYSTLTFPHLKDIKDISFKTHIDIMAPLEDHEYQYLDMFFTFLERAGIFMGSSKSVGLGNFKIECDIPRHFEPITPIDTTGKELKLYRITLRTLEPLVVGSLKNKYIIDTLPYIPASTMGGSIGFCLKRNHVTDDELERLFITDKTCSPFNFYWQSTYPKPASMRSMKGKKETKKDVLLSDYIVNRAIAEGNLENKTVENLFNLLYRRSLRPVPICEKPPTTYNTKVAIGRKLQKSREGMLYSMELIEKDVEFKGLVISEAWVMEALEKIGELFIGGKRTRGFGRTAIVEVKQMEVDDLINPEVSVDAHLRELAAEYPIKEIDENRRFFTLDLLADMGFLPGTPEEDRVFKTFIEEKVFDSMDLRIEKSFPGVIWRGGYDFKIKKEKPLVQKIGAGSTFLVSVPLEQEESFKGKVAKMIEESIHYKWDSTPLFRLNNPEHIEIWR